jgi:hypothetical protein
VCNKEGKKLLFVFVAYAFPAHTRAHVNSRHTKRSWEGRKCHVSGNCTQSFYSDVYSLRNFFINFVVTTLL